MNQRDPNYGGFANVDEVVELRAVWQGLRRRIGTFLLVLVGTFLVVALYAAVAQRFFTAETTMVIQTQQSAVIDESDVLAGSGTAAREINTEVELLRSRGMATRVIRRLQSSVGEEVFGQSAPVISPAPSASPADDDFSIESTVARISESSAESVEPVMDAADNQVAQEAEDDEFAIERPPSLAAGNLPSDNELTPVAADYVDIPEDESVLEDDTVIATEIINQVMSRLQVERVGTTSLIRIRFSSPSPQNAAIIANAFADEYILEQIEAQFKALQQARRFIEARLQVLRVEVRNSEEAASKFRAEYGLVDSDGANVTEQRLNQLADELSKARSELSAAITRLESVRTTIAKGEPIETISEVMSSGLIRELRRQEADIERRRGDLRARYGELHPEMKQISEELDGLQQQIDVEINRIVENLRREVNFAEARVTRLAAEFASIQTDLATENPALVRLRELERDTLASRGLYESLLERQKELNERERLSQADARIISRASPPDSPSRPQSKLILAAGGLLALLFASVAAFVAEVTEKRILSSSDLRRVFGSALPVVLVPQIRRGNVFGERTIGETAEYFVREKPSATFTDSLRELRMHLMLAKDADNKPSPTSIAFTSSFENEGATLVSFCLATLLASEGEKVVFVDANAWRNPSHSEFAQERTSFLQKSLRHIVGGREQRDDVPFEHSPHRALFHETDVARARSLPSIGEEAHANAEEDNDVDMTAVAESANETDTIGEIVVTQPPRSTAVDAPNDARFSAFLRTVNDVDVFLLSQYDGVRKESADVASIETLLQQLSGLYDYIVIDAPPVLDNAEASYFASRADYVVMITEWRSTLRDAVKTACGLLIDAHANFLGFVINKVDERRRHFFRPEDRRFYFKRR